MSLIACRFDLSFVQKAHFPLYLDRQRGVEEASLSLLNELCEITAGSRYHGG